MDSRDQATAAIEALFGDGSQDRVVAPVARAVLAVLQQFETGGAAESRAAWRRLEDRWMGQILSTTVVTFADARAIAELVALHRWEDSLRATGPRSEGSCAAIGRLRELMSRRHR
jgi:hypothetical protein